MRHTKWFLASSLLCSTGVIADQADASTTTHTSVTEKFRHGEKLPKEKYAAGYNAYAGIQVENDSSFPNTYITASFLYYYANQGGMDLADSAATVIGGGPTTAATSNSRTLSQDFAFKPGFKVGVGFGYNESFLSADYTWIRSTTHTNENAPFPQDSFAAGTTGSWVMNNWFSQVLPSGQTMSATNVNSKWQLGLDIGDLLINHAFYQGQQLIVKPFLGLRGAWIRQGIDVTITPPTAIFTSLTSPTLTSKNSSNSWAIGPRVGVDASYLLGMGLRFEGKAAASLLVTQFTHVRHEENVGAPVIASPSTLASQIKKYNCLRPEADLGIGLGWGKYLSKGRYHFDLTANYDFLVFFEQNMIRKLLDQTISGVSPAVSNLYFQGLNITARFDF